MPTILRINGFRFYFYANEGAGRALEPPHIHVDRAGQTSKFWLDPVARVTSANYSTRELNEIEALVREHQGLLLAAWTAFFGR